MTSVTKKDHSAVSALAGGTGQHTGGQAQALLSGGDRDGPKAAGWDVEIHLGDHQITHKACYRGSRRNMAACGVPAEEVIWPAWPVTTADITAASPLPLAGFEQYWHTAGNRLRESAKWMATILGNAMTDGSGFWVGLNAIRAAYRDFASGTDSVLLQRFRQVYGIRNDDGRAFIAKLRDLAIADSNMKKEIARFAASVCDAAVRGDPAAQDIVKKHSEELADVSASLVRRQFSRSDLAAGITIIEVGGLLSNELYRSSYEGQLKLRLRTGVDERAAITWQRAVTANDL